MSTHPANVIHASTGPAHLPQSSHADSTADDVLGEVHNQTAAATVRRTLAARAKWRPCMHRRARRDSRVD